MKAKALQFATKKHSGQTRKVSGLPYITHPVAVAALLEQHQVAEIQQVVALLHDTLEDTETSPDELEYEFGSLVADLVLELTNDRWAMDSMGKLEYMKEKLLKLSSRALTVKLADRLNNMQDSPTEKSKKETAELMTFLKQQRSLNAVQQYFVAAIVVLVK